MVNEKTKFRLSKLASWYFGAYILGLIISSFNLYGALIFGFFVGTPALLLLVMNGEF